MLIMDMLEVKELSVKVEDKLIVRNVSFSLKEATSNILFGPNGSGKTTLISALMGLPEALNTKIKRIVDTSTGTS